MDKSGAIFTNFLYNSVILEPENAHFSKPVSKWIPQTQSDVYDNTSWTNDIVATIKCIATPAAATRLTDIS